MANPRWRFARMSEWQPNSNPVLGEFFSPASDLPERLVRESIQNSMDARHGNEPVRVRFTFSGEQGALDQRSAAPYLAGLQPHVLAVAESDASGDPRSPDDPRAALKRPLSWLAVEDFGTSGLLGEIESNDIEEKGNHFWGFFRQTGISAKDEDKAGSWGLGKWVFPDASAINSYIAVTERRGEQRVLLMGATALKTHLVDGVKYPPEGYYTPTDAQDDSPPLPVDSDADPESDAFMLTALTTFGLDRTAAPGLSVIVLYPKRELTPAVIARAVLTQYFLPVVRGNLTVEIVHPEIDAPDHMQTISRETIGKEVANIQPSAQDDEAPESLRGAIDLARWAIAQENSAHIELPAEKIATGLSERSDELRERYERGDRLAFRLMLDVERKGQAATSDDFRVYLERAPELQKGHDYFVRGYLRIPRMEFIKDRDARALVLVGEQSELGHLLRDSEGPAHALWRLRNEHVAKRWTAGDRRIRSVRDAAGSLLQRLTERPPEQLTHALAKWFPATTPRDNTGGDTSSDGGTTPRVKVPRLPRSPLDIVSASGGFAVRAPKDAKKSLADTDWTVRFAYDSTGGPSKPFKLFAQSVAAEAPDFSLHDGQLHIEKEGCTHDITSENALTLHVHANDFGIVVSGFDSRRDVVVEVQRVPEAASESDEDAA